MNDRTALPDHVRDAAHELADAAINPRGYADDGAESDRRAAARDELETSLLETVRTAMGELEQPAGGPLTRADVTRYELEGISGGGNIAADVLETLAVEQHYPPSARVLDELELTDRIGDEGSPRYCPACGADVIGNDPHAPDCPREALELGRETITVTVDAMEPEQIRPPAGVTVEVHPSGLAVTLTGPPAAVLALLLEQWGDEEWARGTVADADTAAAPLTAATLTPLEGEPAASSSPPPAEIVLPLSVDEAELLAGIVDFGGVDNDNLTSLERSTAEAIADLLRARLAGTGPATRAELDELEGIQRAQEHRRALEYALSQAVHVARWTAPAIHASNTDEALAELEKRLTRLDELEPVARWAKR